MIGAARAEVARIVDSLNFAADFLTRHELMEDLDEVHVLLMINKILEFDAVVGETLRIRECNR